MTTIIQVGITTVAWLVTAFVGPTTDERTLLSLAYELEALRPWRRIQELAPAL